MKVAIIYNKDFQGVINTFGMQNREVYNPATVQRVAESLEKGGHNVEILDGNMHIIEKLQNFMPKVIDGERFGMVFNMAYGIQGESRYTHIPAMLEMLGIPYVGSSPSGHALALDKVITKIIMQKNGINTPDFWVFSSADENLDGVTYPVIVKPKMESVSFGLKVVDNPRDLKEAVDQVVKEFRQQALVEQFIKGREFAVGLLGNDPVEAFPILEFDLENDPDRIQTMDEKKYRPVGKICPARISEDLKDSMIQQSIQAFHALGLRDFARADIRVDTAHTPYILEINSMASLGLGGSFPYAARVAGYEYHVLVNKILDIATRRYFSPSDYSETGTGPVASKPPFLTALRRYIRTRQGDMENFLKKSVNLNTYVRNVEGVNRYSQLIKKELSKLGFSHQVIPQVDTGHLYFYSNVEPKDCDILILGNVDNANQIGGQRYFRMDDQKLYGNGIWSHKAGIVVLISALQALKYKRKLKNIRIGILLTPDHTLQGKYTHEIITRRSRTASFVLGLHGASLNSAMVVSRSGAAVYTCEMNLRKDDRSENVPRANRIFLRFLGNLLNLTDEEKGLIVIPSKINLESNIARHYAHGEARIGVRFKDPEDAARIEQKIRQIFPKNHKGLLDLQLRGGIRRKPLTHTQRTDEIWRVIKDLANELDIRLNKEHRWNSADICFADEAKYILDGFGPVGDETEASEYVFRYSLLEKATLLAGFLCRVRDGIHGS